MLYGLFHLSFGMYLVITLVLTHITTASVTLYLHRSQSHRGVQFHPVISHFFRFWIWLTTGMMTKEWVAVHRKHHAKVESEKDPHSPQIYGIWRVLFRGVWLYRQSAQEAGILEQYGAGTPQDKIENYLYTPHHGKGVLLMLLIDVLLFGVIGLIIWVVQMVWIPFFAAGMINGVGHFLGYRNFECKDASRNIFPWAILIGGEELHNNHHTFVTSAKLSVKWWEFDLGWFYISLLKSMRLAKVKRSIPKLHINPSKLHIDMESVRTVVAHRFQIMDCYFRQVILPVIREEKRRAGRAGHSLFRRASKLLSREESLIDFKARQKLSYLLKTYEDLEVVYQFRLRLQKMWQRTSHNPKELLDNLQEWCKQAEESGIAVLQVFAESLKRYSYST